MKTLYLARHAKSSWKYPELDDFERPLNNRGRRDAPAMGQILRKLKISPDLIISSPATRAATTARIIAEKIKYPLDQIVYNEQIYLAGEASLLDVIKDIDNSVNKAMIFGHNPELTALANFIADSPVSNIPTCAVFCTELNIKSWSEAKEKSGKFRFFEYPKKYSNA